MPVYVYRVIPANPGDPEETFEVVQSIHAPAYTKDKFGRRVERVLCPPIITSSKVGDAQLRNAGFSKYKKTSDGNYEKQV